MTILATNDPVLLTWIIPLVGEGCIDKLNCNKSFLFGREISLPGGGGFD